MNLVDTYRCDIPHVEHVCTLALAIYDELARLGLHVSDRSEREMLWAAGMLHDAGVLVDYNDHHKHGYYLVLNAGLPGYAHHELAMIALLVRGHRKGQPGIAPLEDILRRRTPRDPQPASEAAEGDEGTLRRLACCLRIAEQLERGRARGIREPADDGAPRTSCGSRDGDRRPVRGALVGRPRGARSCSAPSAGGSSWPWPGGPSRGQASASRRP